jgi:mannose-6-phosphate isomerase-like protein (cupin superfamily)
VRNELSRPTGSAELRVPLVSTAMADEREPDAVVDLLGGAGTGPLWGMASSDLNATLLAWPPGHELVEDTNSELDVLLIVLEGGGVARVDERDLALVPGSALLVEKGSSRTMRAGADGVRYVSVHRRRGPLQITDTPGRG